MEKKRANPWSLEAEKIYAALKTAPHGLSEQEAVRRRAVYGTNTFHTTTHKAAMALFLGQLANPLIFILIGAAVVTAILQEWTEVIVIALAVLVNAGLGFYREYHAEHTLEKLATYIKDRSRVIRDGHEQEIDSGLLVPGDVITLAYGSRIPADVRIVTASALRVDESVLTGESLPVEKSDAAVPISAPVAERVGMAHAGTLVVDGFATAVVTGTGDATEIGIIAGLVSNTRRSKTPIQMALAKLSWVIFAIVMTVVFAIFILGIVRGQPIFDMLILAAAVSVGAVPEALPIALTVILSFGAERIARKKGITRTLVAAETLGSTSLIMTDKTGTLTEANMRLLGAYSFASITDNAPESEDTSRSLLAMALSNIDVLVENPNESAAVWTFKGRPFETNIAKSARDSGIDVRYLKSAERESHIVIPFNSTHKFSVASTEGTSVIMGAPDILLARSNVDAATYQKIEAWIMQASAEGKRLIALGTTPRLTTKIADIGDITFSGILVFHDPVRQEVPAAIKRIEALGTRIVMVTGDLKGTAIAVAHELGWSVSESAVLTGADLKSLDDTALRALLAQVKIFARVTPEDKLRIGLLYKSLGEIVAMTGDGVNDAPSLKAMDIGVALGSGSDVAKSAADLVLLDDNFQTISLAIQEGRRIMANIRKTFVYLMSNSLDEVFVIGGSLIVGIPLPLSALQIIWVNLFTGSLPAIAFAYDQDFDHERSKKRTLKSILTREVNILTFGLGIASSLLLFFVYYGLIRFDVPLPTAQSVFFVCFASYVLVIAFSFRSLHKPLFSYPAFSNKRLNQSILSAVIILVLTMAIPAVRTVFGLTAFPLVWLWFIFGWLVLNVFLVESAKYFFRRSKRDNNIIETD